jgi:transposase
MSCCIVGHSLASKSFAMTYSLDFRWRAIALHYVYGVSFQYISDILGPRPRTIARWYAQFKATGSLDTDSRRERSLRWPDEVNIDVREYVCHHPTFFLEELQTYLKEKHPALRNVSVSTICRALRFDLGLSRKILTKAARESLPIEIEIYRRKLECIYSFPEQVLFLDETSKDGRHAFRRYAWSKTNTKAVVRLPFSRGKRLSILACMDTTGFVAWESTPGTFGRTEFHDAFVRHIVPLLNPWPLPRSIVIMDNARIHMYEELEITIHQCGARLLFLPPYSPELNPIEIGFGSLKRWIQKHANLIFPLYPDRILDHAMVSCTKKGSHMQDTFAHCGYKSTALDNSTFDRLMEREDQS